MIPLSSSALVSQTNLTHFLLPFMSIPSKSFSISHTYVHTVPFSTSCLSFSLFKARKRVRKNTIVKVREYGEAEFLMGEASGSNEDYREKGQIKEEDFTYSSAYRGRQDEKDYDKDPELADILGNCFDDPQKAQQRVEDRIKNKKNKILHSKSGSEKPAKVVFNKFDYSNSYIWFEFYHNPSSNDVSLVCDAIRSWHIIGRLGGCNSMNMQLSQAPLNTKLPIYDAIEGANVTPTTFYNIGDFEVQDNLARLWVDIGTREPLLLDVLINALLNISSDYVGIKQLVFGGTGFENWNENLPEDAGSTVHKI